MKNKIKKVLLSAVVSAGVSFTVVSSLVLTSIDTFTNQNLLACAFAAMVTAIIAIMFVSWFE